MSSVDPLRGRDDDAVEEEQLFVFDSWKRKGCGCVISTHRLTSLLQQQQQQHASNNNMTCPKCGSVVKFITDRQSPGNNNNGSTKVLFKFGKQIYELTVVNTAASSSSSSAHLPPAGQAPDASFWTTGNLLSATRMTTAQGRIAQVLSLNVNTMKILCKGKVLYPSTSFSPEDISQQLLDISQKSRAPTHVSLLVMGTLQGLELKQRPRHQQQQDAATTTDSSSSSWTGWLWGMARNAVAMGQSIAVQTLQLTILFLRHAFGGIVQPLLSSSWTRSGSDDTTDANDRRRRRHRDD